MDDQGRLAGSVGGAAVINGSGFWADGGHAAGWVTGEVYCGVELFRRQWQPELDVPTPLVGEAIGAGWLRVAWKKT
ncbi:hypothetical protein [Streptomyces sp. AC154]|uniref:hypothetical protein n=1 Tax=Streptomyces sp. AC154 TaxID=3143184 RepID=UPI003F812740